MRKVSNKLGRESLEVEGLSSLRISVTSPQRRGVQRKKILSFTRDVRILIRSIPFGKVASYGQIAVMAGDARQARQVAWILHSTSERESLPWQRIISAKGRISLLPSCGGREQARRLRAEGVRVDFDGKIDLSIYGWQPRRKRTATLEKMNLTRL